METNTPAVKDPKEFQERLDAIKASIRSKKESEAFPLPKDEEEIPTSEQSDEEDEKLENHTSSEIMEGLGFKEDHIRTLLALLVRDKEFYETYGRFMKPSYFATITPQAPHEIMEQIFIMTQEFFKDFPGEPMDRRILKLQIDEHFRKFKKDEKEKPDWDDLVDEIFDAKDLDNIKGSFGRYMKKFLIVQESKLSYYQLFEDFKNPSIDPEVALQSNLDRETELKNLNLDDLGQSAIDVDEFLNLEFPARKTIINPWLKEGSTGMIAGQMGSGKTFFGITIANGSTTGTSVGNWTVENPIPCVYVDGELEHREMQDRLRNLRIGKRIRKLHLISDAFNVSANLPRFNNLLDPNQRATLFKICEKFKDKDLGLLLILDNISVLCPGIDENKKSDWDVMNTWLLDLKKAGINSLYLHHTGKSGDQRGTSGREDNIDTSILISLPKDYKTEDGCRFNLRFKKKRVEGKYLHLLQDEEWSLNTNENSYEWTITTSRRKSSDQIFLMLAQGIGVREIARSLGMKDHAYVSRIKTKLTANGYFHVNGDLTEKGKLKLDSSTKDDDLEDE